MNPQNFSLPADLRQWLLAFLCERPWREVADVMPRLLTLQPVPEVKAEEKKEPASG